MSKFSLLIVFIMVLFSTTNSQNNIKKLEVMVLYESLCPDSIRFMGQQLGPYYDLLKDYIDIQLVPFGKSNSQNNGAEFICQHGPAECEGNRMQSCVLAQTTDQSAQVKFAVCQMTTSNKSDISECAQSAGLSSDIFECMTTAKGTYLQLQAEQITHSYTPTFVPTIIYDRVFNQRLQDSSIRNFRNTVCYLLQKRGVIPYQSTVCE